MSAECRAVQSALLLDRLSGVNQPISVDFKTQDGAKAAAFQLKTLQTYIVRLSVRHVIIYGNMIRFTDFQFNISIFHPLRHFSRVSYTLPCHS